MTNFGNYNATYGAIGGVMVLMLWFYVSGLAVLAGAELNAEIEHASPYGKAPGEKVPGEKKAIGALAERLWKEGGGHAAAAASRARNDGDRGLGPAPNARSIGPRATDWMLSGLVLAEFALLT